MEQFIEKTLDREAITLGLGVCVVFCRPQNAEVFEASRRRRRIDWTDISTQLRFSTPPLSRVWDGWHGACGNPFFNDGRMESVRNCVDYRPGCRRGLRRFDAITSNDVLLNRGLQDDEDDRALRWKCRECGYISIIQLLQCVAQTCAVLQQKIDGP